MFEVGGPTDGKLVKLAESADTLAKILVYIYPDSIPEFELNFPECLDVIRTLHKYQVGSVDSFPCGLMCEQTVNKLSLLESPRT